MRSASALGILVIALLGAACERPGRGPYGEDGGVVLPPAATPLADVPAPSGARPAAPSTAGSISVRSEPVTFAPIAHAADPSVVTINTVGEELEISPFTHRRRPREMRGLGTGFVVDRNGVVLTNNHVVEGADAILVKLSDEREFPGKVVGTDPPTDIAVVRIDAKDLRPLPLGDSHAIAVGGWVVAIGDPFGLAHTVSAGIVSAERRTQQDVPLYPTRYC